MITVRCTACGKELQGQSSKIICCGCSNMTTLTGDSVTAVDLTKVVMIDSGNKKKDKNVLSDADIAWQEERRKRKIRKMDFEIR